ncbi:hypothetical protein PO909_026599 [Leuciscus waleckii]
MCRTDPGSAPEHHTGATHSGRSPIISSIQREAEAPAGSRRLERGSGYGLRVCLAFFSQTSSLDPLPSRDKPEQGPWPAESPGDLCQQGLGTSRYNTTAEERWVSLRREVSRP